MSVQMGSGDRLDVLTELTHKVYRLHGVLSPLGHHRIANPTGSVIRAFKAELNVDSQLAASCGSCPSNVSVF